MQVGFLPFLADPYCPAMTCIYTAKTEHKQRDNLWKTYIPRVLIK